MGRILTVRIVRSERFVNAAVEASLAMAMVVGIVVCGRERIDHDDADEGK